jgi:hypothetical protein
VLYCQALDKYLSCGRDGTVRLWAAEDVKHARTIANGDSWVTDVLHLRRSRRLVVASMDRAITTYDIHRDCEQVGKVRRASLHRVPRPAGPCQQRGHVRAQTDVEQGNASWRTWSSQAS